ncbi:MAG: 30S ribosomal protein S6e [archaeon GW2011_AR20]|nr:MAG: 30S ribosomal protein S6e [archaeon GW2011_AR20]MBS3160125.1 30S ribosomal protein S6e [Candidatus Woesearchaeota archaeon]
MPEFKIVISEKGKSYSKTLTSGESESLLGKKIKDKVEGSHVGLKGYEFDITGGSDKEGFPMRHDVEGLVRKKIFVSKGQTGTRLKIKGVRIRKAVASNIITNNISQVNLKVVKTGQKALDEIFGKTPKEEVKAEEKTETQAAPKVENKE